LSKIMNTSRDAVLRFFHRGSSRMLPYSRQTNPCAPRLRVEGIANPDDHSGFGGERQHFRVENFRAAGGEGAGLIVAELMQKARFGGFVGIGGEDAIDIGPDDQFVGVHDMSADGSRKIRAVAAASGDSRLGVCRTE